ncbi:formyl transferase [Thermodesulfobacterium sp. TA1]|uniref:formyltransferase family protein n=1 Tax=Thermodesulfobacterium sp. TA1 TaxID=2234087 RepID=UPI001232D246|nr:formyltransferase family protein [Thermodesulfobacterium sp. TA1]QER41252.1 formyl transferase [Thermodesulfobacterium sp. TA1]
MSYKTIGWFTTGRDKAALDLLRIVYTEIKRENIPAKLAYVFVSKAPDEGEWAERLIKEATEEMQLRVIWFSAERFKPELRKTQRDFWRKEYHEEVLKRLDLEIDFGVLAGYMWITSEEFCKRLKLINLHPSLPGGPKGSWQEVIWQLISARAMETGAMIHRVTPELDEGPALTYFRLNLRTPEFIPLWKETELKLLKHHLSGLKKLEGEKNPLFVKIREEEVKRELPLLVFTLKYLCEEKLGVETETPLDLTQEVEKNLTAFTIE